MRKIPFVLAAASLALAAGAAQAQQSWGPKHTTYWSSDATGKYQPGQFMTSAMPVVQPPAAPQMQAPARQQRMYYQPAAKRMRAPMRVRQQQPGMRPGQPPANQGMPPAERGEQPPADAKPSAPPSQGQPPMQNQQPGQVPK
jgi:hypothetical protein